VLRNDAGLLSGTITFHVRFLAMGVLKTEPRVADGDRECY